MSATRYPFQIIGGMPVVTAPAEIDTTTAGQLGAILLEWHARRHTTAVVVDMTGPQFCGSAGGGGAGRGGSAAGGAGGGRRRGASARRRGGAAGLRLHRP